MKENIFDHAVGLRDLNNLHQWIKPTTDIFREFLYLGADRGFSKSQLVLLDALMKEIQYELGPDVSASRTNRSFDYKVSDMLRRQARLNYFDDFGEANPLPHASGFFSPRD